jgi:drug/metabolite transporter (DMT)-like permease
MPEPSLGETRTPGTPKEVVASFWVWVVGAVLSLGTVVTLFANLDRVKRAALDQYDRNPAKGVSREQFASFAQTAVIVVAVIFILIALLFVFFAFKMHNGRNWARIVLTVLAVIVVILNITSSSVLGVITALLAIVAAVLMYLPNSNAYFTQMKRIG